MILSMFQFRPALIPTLMVVFLVPAFMALGQWQLERAQQKRNLASQLDTRRKLPQLKLDPKGVNFEEVEFRTLSVTGRLSTDKQVLIENRKHRGKNGYHVMTPMQIDGSDQYLLINRGWVASQSQALRQAPDQNISVSGRVIIPLPPALVLNKAIPGGNENIWPYLTLERYQEWSGLNIAPFLLLQDPNDSTGFIRQWPLPQYSDTMHIGYAIQWYAFAVIALGTWLRLSLQRSDNTRGNA